MQKIGKKIYLAIIYLFLKIIKPCCKKSSSRENKLSFIKIILQKLVSWSIKKEFLLISNLDTIRNMPYGRFIRKHAGSNTTDLIIYL